MLRRAVCSARPLAGSSSPSQKAVRGEEAVLVADALEQLPEDYREVIVLRHLEGLAFQDVARHMKRSVDSVHRELGLAMWEKCGMARNEKGLKELLAQIPKIREGPPTGSGIKPCLS